MVTSAHALRIDAARGAKRIATADQPQRFTLQKQQLGVVIGASELTHAVKEIENLSFRTFEIYLIGTLLYLVFSLLIMAVAPI